jgi:hypothetical protein
MTARMYYDNDAESSGEWRRGAPPSTLERQLFDVGLGAHDNGEVRAQ